MRKRLKEPERLKELAGEATENQLARIRLINVSANEIWLARLGAFSKAPQEGAKVFEALVAVGEKVQERIKVAADARLAQLREKATGVWDELDKVFEDRVARALHTLNVPSRYDIDTLTKQVHELTVTKKLSEEEKLSEKEEMRVHRRAHRAKAR
jgi:poly(hydroxyalkanoate) granule-associated protein